jgi:ligand-binding sensor domain-containing protein
VKGKCNAEGFCNQPVYMVDAEGDTISVQAVAATPDGRVWFASGRTTTADTPRGLAVWDGKIFRYYDPGAAGMAETDVRDMIALPDGRLVLAGTTTGLVIWNPQTGASVAMRGSQWLPDDHVLRIELDQMVNPPTLHVATWGGAAAIRKLP